MIKEAIKKVVDGNNLTYDEAAAVMNEMMSGTATQAQTAAFLTALRIKGETIDEITACATVMRDKALHVKRDTDVLDIVGTGGDGTGTFNISTTAAFCCCGRRNFCCKARQPFNVKQERCGRLSGGSWS